MKKEPVTAVIVGAGHRGVGYATYSHLRPDELRIVGVAEPNDVRRARAQAIFDIPAERAFRTAEELAQQPQFADAAINGTMDRQHIPTTLPLLQAGYDVLLESPSVPRGKNSCSCRPWYKAPGGRSSWATSCATPPSMWR